MRKEFQKYRGHVDHLDITEDQKDDLLEAVYSIVESFVDRGFHGHDLENFNLTDAESSGSRGQKRVYYGHSPKIEKEPNGRYTP